MSDTVTVALISTSGTFLVAVTALLLNYRGFVSLERRMERTEDDEIGRASCWERV